MKIGELSKETGVSIRSLRYYEKKNLIRPPRQENGYREYEESDIETVKAVQLFLKLGMNTEEIYQVLSCGDFQFAENKECAQDAIDLYSERLINVREQINNLQEIEIHLEKLMKYWEMKKEESGD
ncbi:MerR family transcriptional regulator [Oceanobacillus neutriphilus]|uniref:Transcriptional regulator n=1 Tax=Oceanobacillus neutriphilus TaxID=531815 RepID=A0ABQ2NUQ5_9BACI|nr:MerR family transcriptional regulator [Oceanobacillus neutriphilus]GGP11012.1 transcriptional regulator [Oceanobacillus neutriphilus]